MRQIAYVLIIACVWAFASVRPARACLWDSDTLAQERQAFPTALELIAGKFRRHSRAFYAWRVEDRRRRLEATPKDWALYDDLAVALDKLGDHAAAIETMQRKATRAPDLYETEANLGTFHAHAGHYDEALVHIRRAIEINPDAHFGREIFQALLIEYVQTRVDDDGVIALPLARPGGEHPADFAAFVAQANPGSPVAEPAWIGRAMTGVLGMMRFGDHESPILLEALGDLAAHRSVGHRRIACRAYLRAAQRVNDDEASRAFRALAEVALEMQEDTSTTQVQSALDAELDDAAAWFAELSANEARWIDDPDADPELEYGKRYDQDPELPSPDTGLGWAQLVAGVAVTFGAGLGLLFFARMRWRQRSSS